MAQRESALFTVTPKSLSGLAVIFLLLAAFFALLNGQKVKALRSNGATPRAPLEAKVNAPTRAPTGAQERGKTADADRAAKAEAALAQGEKEKSDLKGKLDASQQEIAALRQRAAGTGTNSNPSTPGIVPAPAENPHSADLQSQVDDLRHQLDAAERSEERRVGKERRARSSRSAHK